MKKIACFCLSLFVINLAIAQVEGASELPDIRSSKIIYGSPVKITEYGVGFELGFEGNIDKAGYVAYNLPVSRTFDLLHNDGNYDFMGKAKPNNPMTYFNPGIKIYPTGNNGKVKYAVGATLAIGRGVQSEAQHMTFCSYYEPPGGSFVQEEYPNYMNRKRFILGAMLSNSLTISSGKHLITGFDFSGGYTFINKLDGVKQETKILLQGGFRMGYRL